MRTIHFSLLSTCCLLSLFANPENGIVIEGNASFERGASELVVRASDRSIIHWDSFSIDANEITRFVQGGTDAAVLNRVTGDQMSQLMGSLIADGKVFLINPNGVIVGKEGMIDAASFIASSFDISNDAFLSGEDFGLEGALDAKRVFVGVRGKKSLYFELREDGNPYCFALQNNQEAIQVQVIDSDVCLIRQGSLLINPNPKTEPLIWTAISESLESSSEGFLLASCPLGSVELVDPNPTPSPTGFGDFMLPLANGNVVVTKRDDHFSATNSGAVYLYNADTGALISALRGSNAGDLVGDQAVALANGNYVVGSSQWQNPATGATFAGAATWASGTTGVGGFVSGANSLIGTQHNDEVGVGIFALKNGNYVVQSSWANGPFPAFQNCGAVTWGDGLTGIVGEVTAANSLVGTVTGDNVGSGSITLLKNGNYVVASSNWQNVATGAVIAGAATWGNGTGGTVGAVSGANSLIGTSPGDGVSYAILPLTNGNYVVASNQWKGGAPTPLGAATWGNGTIGTVGEVAVTNSLFGSTPGDAIALTLTSLSNGNYVVNSPSWQYNGLMNTGAVTWGNGTGGTVGAVSVTNSLVGTTAGDRVGNGVEALLVNGNYVVASDQWQDFPGNKAGAATWGNGTNGTDANGNFGFVSVTNSFVGTQANDYVGTDVKALTNGNYVVRSINWEYFPSGAVQAGAATWGNGTTGQNAIFGFGAISEANSLVGTQPGDIVSNFGIAPLTNGNYVVVSNFWANGTLIRCGAVTWGNGATGTVGIVSPINSLVGSQSNDFVGENSVTALYNGNYVVGSSNWNNFATGATQAGASTWGNGMGGIAGEISETNSLIGTQTMDFIGQATFPLANGNYVLRNPSWANGPIPTFANSGAITWGNGATGIVGTISSANSLVGTQAGDNVSNLFIFELPPNYFAVGSSTWADGTLASAGAVTLGNSADGTFCDGTFGPINSVNSFVGANANAGLNSTHNNPVVVSTANGNEIVVQFKDYAGQTRVFSIPHLAPSAAAAMIPIAKGIHDFAIAITEPFAEWEWYWLTLKDLMDSTNIYAPLGTYKGLMLMLPSLVSGKESETKLSQEQ